MEVKPPISLKTILHPHNRGVLLDIVMFCVQLVLFYLLANQFRNVARGSIAGDIASKAGVTLFCISLVILSPVAAILKRHPTRLRNPNFDDEFRSVPSGLKRAGVIAYFVSQFLFWLAASFLTVELWEDIYGKVNSSALFTPLFFGLPVMSILNSLIFVFYFLPIKRPPLLSILATPQAEILGDACLFLNMILFQIFWCYVMADLTVDYKGLLPRLSTFCFTALIIYFPPRLFYLAEHIYNKKVWLLMLLANSPILLRILFAP